MNENDKTKKQIGTGINASAFISQMPFVGKSKDSQTTEQTKVDGTESMVNAETIQPEGNQETEKVEKQAVKRKKALVSIDYPDVFLGRYELRTRQGIYIEKETNRTIKKIVGNIGDERLTVSGFIENVLQHHFETYKDEINNLYESQFKKPIK